MSQNQIKVNINPKARLGLGNFSGPGYKTCRGRTHIIIDQWCVLGVTDQFRKFWVGRGTIGVSPTAAA